VEDGGITGLGIPEEIGRVGGFGGGLFLLEGSDLLDLKFNFIGLLGISHLPILFAF
jgi:hypothetical protein